MTTALHTYSEVDGLRLTHLSVLAEDVVARAIPGDVVECGVAAGGSAAALAWTVRGSGRHCWLYDSFAGLPPPTTKDGPEAGRYVGANRAAVDLAHQILRIVGADVDRCHLVVGPFADTFAAPDGPREIALLHIDADWYESVGLCLRTWYDRVSPGGVIVLDDFGFWPGCRHAFYEFCVARAIAPNLERYRDQGWWRKA